jgi:glycosyltransferase involved in cell wall biosynthesis
VRLLFLTQRYGPDIAGGAETACRELAERLAERGHRCEVIASCARSYVDWSDSYPPGTSAERGVTVHRLPVREPRDPRRFGPLHSRVDCPREVPLPVQRDWRRLHGPDLPGLASLVEQRSADADVTIAYTYLYTTGAVGLPLAAARTATIFHPAAHDEPFFYRDVFDDALRASDLISCHTPEEEALVKRRLGPGAPTEVLGLGVDPAPPSDPARFRRTFGLGERPYVVYLGRLDPGKGADESYRYMRRAVSRLGLDVAFVVMGDPVVTLEPTDDVIVTGFVDEATKHDALAGAALLLQPSYFESFSIVVVEAWSHGVPVLAQGACEVLAGQMRRSGGGLTYRGYAEFEVALAMLLGDASLRRRLGEAGRRYADAHYRWDRVLDHYEAMLAEARRRFESRWRTPWPTRSSEPTRHAGPTTAPVGVVA